MTTWVPRHELALPNELLYSIISWVLVNSVHSICVSTGDVSWDKNVMNILCDVSPAFKAIAMEIISKAFEISKATDEEQDRWVVNSRPAIFDLMPKRFSQTICNVATDLRIPSSARCETQRSFWMGNCVIPSNGLLGVAIRFRVRLVPQLHISPSTCRPFTSWCLWRHPSGRSFRPCTIRKSVQTRLANGYDRFNSW